MAKLSIFWFRRDLRLEDNVGLFEALSNSKEVLPIFIFDKTILEHLPKEDKRVAFISELLQKIQKQLIAMGKSLAVFYGKPIDVFKKLIAENDIQSVYLNRDYEPAAIARDKEIFGYLASQNIQMIGSKDQVIFEKNEVMKPDNTPYRVFTPYSKAWKHKLKPEQHLKHSNSIDLLNKIYCHSYPFFASSDIGFTKISSGILPFNYSKSITSNYSKTRNIPSINGTSNLSPHLRFGSVSIRKIIQSIDFKTEESFLNELIWREFFMMILYHFPYTTKSCFRPEYDEIQWENNEHHFDAWKNGKTGYPIVDAAMQQLNQTGYMHNRCRMIVASFLCKDLLIDWRWGEAYFALKLLDYEQSSNIGNWQWAAGCGVDAAPYFRVFNPIEQQRKFDPNYEYIQKWIPNFNPYKYREPIVDHSIARNRCIDRYKKALNKN